MAELWKCAPFEISMKIWGYELAGEATEFSAMVSENRNSQFDETIQWDHDLPQVLGYEMWIADELQPPKWLWALRWFTMKAPIKMIFPEAGL